MQLEYQEAIEDESKPKSSPQIPLPPRRDIPEPPWLLPVMDVVLSVLAFLLAYFARYELTIFRPVLDGFRSDFWPYVPYALVYAGLLYFSYHSNNLYKRVRGRSLAEEAYTIINGVTTATVILLAMYFAFQPLVFSRLMLIYVAAITIILLISIRAVRRIAHAHLRSKGIGVTRVLIVGAGETGQAVLRALLARKDLAYYPVGFVDDNPDRGNVDLGRVKGLGNLENLRSTIRRYQVDLVIITIPWSDHSQIQQLVRTARKAGTEVQIVPDMFQLNMRQVRVENLDGIPLLGVNGDGDFKGTNRVLKRLIDVGLIILASPILLVIFAVTALAIRLEGPGPILYAQRRVGENGREFYMIKFRSMILDAEKYRQQLVREQGEDPRHPKIKNDPRVTRVGAFIRATSIDELPQLINVLLGEMSLVGPRPPTPDEVMLYEAWHMRRLQIIPGITGLWQVSGRSDVPFDEMCLLDIYYIENWSVRMDLQILAMTLPRVLLRHGAY
ncbi:MAG: sugar transferase [Anaerolineae bacterium]|nr:sugar transferase [Anaerolineae bacterium]